MAFPFDSQESGAAFGPALARLSRAVDTEAACGYVTLVNLARKERSGEDMNPGPRVEEEDEEGGSPAAQNLGRYLPTLPTYTVGKR